MGILIVHLSKKNYLKKTYSKKKLIKIKKLILPNTFIIEPKVFYDKRGFLYEIWRQDLYFKNKIKFKIVQVLHSYSKKNTLRGIHFQFPNLQGRLVSVINGKIFDVIVDIRKNSPTFGKWCGCIIDSKKKQQLWIPEGFGHGYLVLSKTVDIIYKCTGKYFPNKILDAFTAFSNSFSPWISLVKEFAKWFCKTLKPLFLLCSVIISSISL